MSFILYMLTGFAAGLLGGMGMGGGTILIPALSLIMGVEQHIAQATNLIAFLPMAALSLPVHKRQGLLETEGTLPIVIAASVVSFGAGLLATMIPAYMLKKTFGIFLIILAILKTPACHRKRPSQ